MHAPHVPATHAGHFEPASKDQAAGSEDFQLTRIKTLIEPEAKASLSIPPLLAEHTPGR